MKKFCGVVDNVDFPWYKTQQSHSNIWPRPLEPVNNL